MKDKTKIIMIYLTTFILFLANSTVKDTTVIEIILKEFGISTFYSNGEVGFYYPTILILIILVLFGIYLHKTIPKNKFSKNYFYNCLLMVIFISIIKNQFFNYF